MCVPMYNSIYTVYVNCMHILMFFDLLICVHYCIDVYVVKLIYIQFNSMLIELNPSR